MKTTVFNYKLYLLILFISTSAFAQTSYQVSDESKMVIKGTSSLHDWESDVTTIKGKGKRASESQSTVFQSFTLTIPVESIKSGKSAMDKNTYKAMNEDKYPNIEFVLNNIKSEKLGKVTASGELSIAGETKPVTLVADYERLNSGQISLKGSHTMKMTDFGVEPPTAVFGTIKTGDEITIDYTLYLEKTN